ncbi:hypothetical protein TUSST3_37120 [Streptomyces sp. TUS-ST3]|nr:hypothetical protein TUSST3_37120 [Streptomyces sp. TUS-ST3]
MDFVKESRRAVPPSPGLRPPRCPYSPSCSLTPTTATATAHRAASPGDTIALPVRDALAALSVHTESRNEVLPEEAVTAPEHDAS